MINDPYNFCLYLLLVVLIYDFCISTHTDTHPERRGKTRKERDTSQNEINCISEGKRMSKTTAVSVRQIVGSNIFLHRRSWREDYMKRKEETKEEKRYFSSYVSHYINLCWTNSPCWGDNVTAGVSAETAKINLK